MRRVFLYAGRKIRHVGNTYYKGLLEQGPVLKPNARSLNLKSQCKQSLNNYRGGLLHVVSRVLPP